MLFAFALLVVVALPPLRAAPAAGQKGDFVMIIARSTGIDDIPSAVLRTAFLNLRAEHQGVRLIPLNLPQETPARERLDRALLGLTQSEVGNFWVDQRIRDGRQPPRTVPSAELVVRVVAQLPGAIACVPSALAEAHVQALRIDGKGPSDSGYLLAR